MNTYDVTANFQSKQSAKRAFDAMATMPELTTVRFNGEVAFGHNDNPTELSDHDLLVKTIETLKVMGENIALLMQGKAHRDLKESGKEARIQHLDSLLGDAPNILSHLPLPQWAQESEREPLARKDDDIGIDSFNISTERLVNQINVHLTSYWRQRLTRKDPEPVQTHWTAEEEAILCDRGGECIDRDNPFVDWLVRDIAKKAKAKEDTQKPKPEIVKPWRCPSLIERSILFGTNKQPYPDITLQHVKGTQDAVDEYGIWIETLDYCMAIAREFTDSQKPWGQRGLWTPAYLTYASGTRAEWRSKCSAFPELFRFELLESCDKFILSVGVDRLNLVFGVKG